MNHHRLEDLLALIRRADSVERLQQIRTARLAEITPEIDAAIAARVQQIKRGR